MGWFSSIQQPGHLTEALFHFNEALDREEQGLPRTEVSHLLFNALNKIQTEWVSLVADHTMGEVKAFQTMMLKCLHEDSRHVLLASSELRTLAEFEPPILNHDVLRRHDYRPGVEIRQDLATDASEVHRKLKTAYNGLVVQREKEIEDRVLKRAAELLYVVRSNIAHGEKTPYGPDLKKRERDEQVSTIVVPIQMMLFDMLLDYPSRKLFAYGTLAPGKPNHTVLSGLEGSWQDCLAKGRITERRGLPLFYWEPLGADCVEGRLFVSPDLPRHWARLDHFEGKGYKRRIVFVKTNDGSQAANAYLGTDMPKNFTLRSSL